MSGARVGSCGGDGEARVYIERDRRETDFRAACLISQLHRDLLRAERSVRERGERKMENYSALVNVQGLFGKGEGAEFSFGIRDFADFESGGDVGFQIGGDEVVFRFFAGVDMKAGTNLQDNGELKRTSAGHWFERNESAGRDNVPAGRHLRRRRQSRDAYKK
jgi:hypothetical protein